MGAHRVYLVLCTVPEAEAASLAERLVQERLVACVNIIGPVQSIYRWQGAMEQGSEMLLFMKTVAESREELRSRIDALHSYSTPEVLEVGVDSGLPGYLAWVAESCGEDSDRRGDSDQGRDV